MTKDTETSRLEVNFWEALRLLAQHLVKTNTYQTEEHATADLFAASMLAISRDNNIDTELFNKMMREGVAHWVEEIPTETVN